jgi:hypothetical protein
LVRKEEVICTVAFFIMFFFIIHVAVSCSTDVFHLTPLSSHKISGPNVLRTSDTEKKDCPSIFPPNKKKVKILNVWPCLFLTCMD